MNAGVEFDAQLMRRYDREGPRYTSYPTAMQFREGLPSDAYAAAAAASAGALAGGPLSLYVHIPFCRSPCFYCGCNKIVTRQMDRAETYLKRMLAEIELRSVYFARDREVLQLHFGGGTPTYLSPRRLGTVVERIDRHFRLSNAGGRDYSIEIDPRTVDARYLHELSELGFNRLSLGVQDFNADVQRAVNRVQPAAQVASLLESARCLGFHSINFDLIYGLPLQTQATFATTLAAVIEMRPDRIAVYGYAHMPQAFKAQRQIRGADLPDARTRLALLQLAVDELCGAGYVYIGMDHFALPSDGLALAQRNGTLHRSFQGYTTHASCDLVSVGVSAIGHVGELYVQNQKGLPQYEESLSRGALPTHRGVITNDDDALRADVIGQLMCYGRVDLAATEHRHGIEFGRYFCAELASLRDLAADGLVDIDAARIAVTPRGRLLLRNVAMVFDAYAVKAAGTDPGRMSRVI